MEEVVLAFEQQVPERVDPDKMIKLLLVHAPLFAND